MKIVHKIILANILHILAMAVILFFAYQSMNLILAKLRFVEIADDLNASFLEMRLSEKNYFLYHDKTALESIEQKLNLSMSSVESVKPDIIRVIGERGYAALRVSLLNYLKVIRTAQHTGPKNAEMEETVREAGQDLRGYSHNATYIERKKVNEIIARSENVLLISFCLVLIAAIGISHLILRTILKSMKKIEEVADSISQGNFGGVKTSHNSDELGSVMRALSSMSQELEKREEIIVQSKKLESLGILTAGVAHELGNPLNNIAMIAQGYMEIAHVLTKEDCFDYMKRVHEETERIEHIVQDLLSFSRTKKTDFKPADINAVITKSLRLVRNMLRVSNIETRVDLEPDLPRVVMDENKILEVLINLMTNGIQAMSPGGMLSISTRISDARDAVVIVVKDTGKGISSEFLPHIFDPFFSTKGMDGTGLGLSVSYGIIKNHKGTMTVDSTVNVGTSITVRLPVHGNSTDSQGDTDGSA